MVAAVGVVALLVGVVQIVLLVRLARGLKTLAGVQEKLGHFSDALLLLTETTESGFQAMAVEIGRQATAVQAPRGAESSTRRLAAAAKRGRSVEDIASAEQVSEGEVRLRLHLAEHAAGARARKRMGAGHGALRT